MPSACTLEEFLTLEESNLQLRLASLVSEQGPEGPWVVKMIGTPLGTQMRVSLVDATYPRLQGDGIDAVIEEIRQAVLDQWGAAPSGVVQVRVYKAGQSGHRKLQVQRKLEPEMALTSASEGEDPNVAFLKQQLSMWQHLAMQSHARMLQSQDLLANTTQQSHQQIVTLSTSRNLTSAAADVTGPWQILSMIFLLASYPMARQILGIPENVTMLELVQRSASAFSALLDDPSGKGPPPEVYAAIEEAAKLPSAEDVLGSLRKQPRETLQSLNKLMEEVRAGVLADPELLKALSELPEGRAMMGPRG